MVYLFFKYFSFLLSFNLIHPRLNLHPYRSHSNLTCLVQVFYLFGGEGEASFLTVEGLVVSSFFTGSVLSLGFPVNKIYHKKLKNHPRIVFCVNYEEFKQ
jgi:hypothetical protein